jgi:hypothetical protein
MRELVEMLQQAHRCGDISHCGVHSYTRVLTATNDRLSHEMMEVKERHSRVCDITLGSSLIALIDAFLEIHSRLLCLI